MFSFRGIPFCVLLDTDGKVAFMGHPASRKFEDDFKTLLDGKKLTGLGTTAGGGDDSDEEGAGGKVMSGGDLAGAMEAFETGVAGVKGDSAVMESAKKLMRAFLVLVQQSTFDTASKEFKTDLKHYQVLVGPRDALDSVKGAASGLRDNKAWETILREQAM